MTVVLMRRELLSEKHLFRGRFCDLSTTSSVSGVRTIASIAKRQKPADLPRKHQSRYHSLSLCHVAIESKRSDVSFLVQRRTRCGCWRIDHIFEKIHTHHACCSTYELIMLCLKSHSHSTHKECPPHLAPSIRSLLNNVLTSHIRHPTSLWFCQWMYKS